MESNDQTNLISLQPLSNIVLGLKLKEEPLFFRKDLICSDKCILNCSETLIYTIKNYPETIKEFTFKIDYIKTPINHPTSFIVQNAADMLSAYKSSNVLDKQTITLDPLFASDFSEQPLESKINHICFAKIESFSENVIAVVTNYGQCEILTFNLKKRIWDQTKLQVNKLWTDIFPSSLYYNKTTITDFNKIRKYIEDYTITSCCWLNNNNIIRFNESILFCSTISGWILIIKIMEQQTTWSMEFKFKLKTDLYKINYMQSYSYIMKNGIQKTIIICGDIKGRIKVYKFSENNNELIEIYTLWSTKDHMSSKNYIINYCPENELLFFTTSKSSHFLLFIISASDDKKIFSKVQFCETQIIGYDYINPYEYLISTINGSTKYLKIIKNIDNITYSFLLTNIINDFEMENYITIGMIATPNKVGWMFLFYPHKVYIQTQSIKNYGFISIYSLNIVEPLQILKNMTSDKYSQLELYSDCNEIIRLNIQKNISIENYTNFSIQPIEINDHFLHRLRLQLILTEGFCGYNLRKIKNRGENIEIEKNNIIIIIKVISAYCRLKYLQSFENLSNFQKQSVKYLRRYLSEYLAKELNEKFLYVRNILKIHIENLLESTQKLTDLTEEICRYCRQNVDVPTESCKHNFQRCCISFVEIPNITMKKCERCKSVALNDDNLLKQVLFENEKIKCLFCTFPLITNI